MTDNEKAVMTDCYKLLNEFSNPPLKTDPACDDYWSRMATALTDLSAKHRNHPLATKVSTGIFEYLEEKFKAINRKKGV